MNFHFEKKQELTVRIERKKNTCDFNVRTRLDTKEAENIKKRKKRGEKLNEK